MCLLFLIESKLLIEINPTIQECLKDVRRKKKSREPDIILYSDTHTAWRTKEVQPAHVHINAQSESDSVSGGAEKQKEKCL